MKILALDLCVVLSLLTCFSAQSETTSSIRDVRAALQNSQFEEAVKLVDTLLPAAQEDRDLLIYLKGLALFYNEKYPDAVKACDEIVTNYKESSWYRKAVFLKAACLIKQKQFEKAEVIYDEEVRRLLSASRKEEIAGVYFRFGEAVSRKPGKDELDAPPPNYGKAYELYKKALELEIGRDLRDEAMFRLGRMMQLAGNFGQAINDYHQYLDEFDPDWGGPVDSPRRQKKLAEHPGRGKHVYEARYHLAESQLASDQARLSRINLEDLIKLIPPTDSTKLTRDSRFLLIRTYHIPNPQDDEELALGVKAARGFLTDFPNDPRSMSIAFEIGQAYEARGRSEDAISAYRDFLKIEQYEPDIEQEKDESGESPAERFERLRMSATYKIGEIMFSQKNYQGAVGIWSQYVAQFPNGPQWSNAQQGIVNAEFQTGVELLAEEKYDEATGIWDKFLEKHPLDGRSRQIMFVYGQLHYHAAEKDKTEYPKAIAEWEKLVNKYPNTEESSLALFKIGQIYEEKLGDLEKALEAYRKLRWGSWQGEAQKRISDMTNKKLQLVTERVFRTNQTAQVKINLRNIEKLTVNVYKVDMEAYWRKMHGITGVENLDIALIAPDDTWEHKVPDYQKYKLFEQSIDIPMEGAGVYAVNVGEDDLEATTLVIRSDIDAIIKTSRREVLIFAENMIDGKPAPGAKVLISDGAKVISEGETGEDGVFQKKLDGLKDAARVTAFVVKAGSVASDLLDISGLGLSQGLTPRGYLYTDRPAYRPGQKVSIRGIIRDASDGSYSVSEGAVYRISVVDSQGRLLRSEELELSKFGTFYTEMTLDDDAPIGEYLVTAQSKDDEGKVYNGAFQVQKYQLEKMKLAIEFPRRVYFRGEEVEATFIASYYYGQPVSDRPVKYTLPDGRSYTEQTDAEGKIKVKFDTTPIRPDTNLNFFASIEGENVQVADSVFLARLGFSIGVKLSAETVISGEPFDVFIETKGADGKPVGKELTLTIYRQMKQASHPILSQVPWIGDQPMSAGEVKVEEHKLVTDDKTGRGQINLALEAGGSYVLRAAGVDRFDQPVSDENRIFISDDKDDVKLRMFAERTRLKVGEAEKVKVHSRLESALALVTFEGEGIIDHRIVKLNKGWNEIDFTVRHEHFPNFHIAIAAIDGQALRTAGKDFTVERQLLVSMKLKEFYLPGEKAEVEVTATDQLGNPVESELSLALVDEALFALYADNVQIITDFFNEGIRRDAAMRTASSCTFRYEPATHRVLKELLEEAKRLEMEDDFANRRVDMLKSLNVNGDVAQLSLQVPQVLSSSRAPLAPMEMAAEAEAQLADKIELDRKEKFTNGRAGGAGSAMMRRARATSGKDVSHFAYFATDSPVKMDESLAFGLGTMEGVAAREEFIGAGYWLPAVVTDAAGKAKAEILMPENATQWRLTARGCTVETLVGQNREKTITRKDFFLDIKLPSILTEGDKVRVLARVHNISDFSGEAQLRLKINIEGEEKELKKSVKIEKNSTAEVVFDEMEIAAGREAKVEVAAMAGDMTDAVSRTIPIRLWGMEYADSAGGAASGDETAFLQLPDGHTYSSKQMDISVRPSVLSLIFDLAMNRHRPVDVNLARRIPPVPGDAGSDLLAAAYALGYLKSVGGDLNQNRELMEYARGLTARLVVSQKDDGGWSWCGGSAESDVYTSSRAFWALAEARRQGVKVYDQTMEKGGNYLKEAFARAAQNDDDSKSVILQALSSIGEADFAYANRLYRNRNEMNLPALAYTALTFVNLSRNEIGGEMLDVLEQKIGKILTPATRGEGGKSLQRADNVETIALALLAMEYIRPNSPLVKQAVDYLLSKRSFYGYSTYKAKGPAVAALAVYYGKAKPSQYDFSLEISVNGESVKTAKVRGDYSPIIVSVPAKLIKDKENRVNFKFAGTGEYIYNVTLSGFSSKIADPKSWDRPFIESRKYYHAPLEYRGRQIASSTTEITQLEDGKRTYVSVNIKDGAQSRYLVIREYLPVGTMLVDNSVSGNYQHHQIDDGMITFYYRVGEYIRDYQYQLVSYSPGAYRVLPTVISDAMKPGDMRISDSASLEVLAPGEKSRDVYKMNDSEFYELGKAYFDDGKYPDALDLLSQLYARNREYNQREVARMLLWIHTEDTYYDQRKVVEYFEILRERFPELYIPFDKILVVGRAYRDIEEFERAYLVYKATIDASFINDSNVSAVLEDEGQFLSSIDFQENLWREYPDSPQVISSYFALSQAIYSKVPEARELAKTERQIPLLKDQDKKGTQRKITKLDLLKETVLMLSNFMTFYPGDPLIDDASFSLANAMLDLEDFERVVNICKVAQVRYPESEYLTSFQYVEALGLFSQNKYDEAVDAAKLVADGKSKDRDLARYILGQIYHAQGKPETAIEWYQKVRDMYPDARESISYFEEKRVSLDEVKVVRPNEDAKIKINYRNIKELSIQVYSVDLMKLYLREKDLSNIRAVQLAGIEPEFSNTMTLGDGKDYVNKEREVDLNLKEEGAYLVICRGDDLFSSGLVLITPLEIEVQEDAGSGRVRVNVRDVVKDTYRKEVHVKAVGSAEKVFKSGETDLRGLFIADDVRGVATVIARDKENLYAFYRGKQWLGPREEAAKQQEKAPQKPGSRELGGADYRSNIMIQNQAIQASNYEQFDQMRRGVQKGVQVQQAH